MEQNSPWPFVQWLELSVRSLGLSPQDFWSMSLCDWLSIIRLNMDRQQLVPLHHEQLMSLMTQFPDSEE